MTQNQEHQQVNEALNRVVRDWLLLSGSGDLKRKFFFCSIPTELSNDPATHIKTDAAHDPKALANVLRKAADMYDPPTT